MRELSEGAPISTRFVLPQRPEEERKFELAERNLLAPGNGLPAVFRPICIQVDMSGMRRGSVNLFSVILFMGVPWFYCKCTNFCILSCNWPNICGSLINSMENCSTSILFTPVSSTDIRTDSQMPTTHPDGICWDGMSCHSFHEKAVQSSALAVTLSLLMLQIWTLLHLSLSPSLHLWLGPSQLWPLSFLVLVPSVGALWVFGKVG